MPLRHALHRTTRRLTRRYPFLRRLTLLTTALTLLWLYTLHWGERATFTDHIASCAWSRWENWPKTASPHHMVLIADPQLVDPHTYPGRPWPLSSLTESYTDAYMARNFRLLNERLDPDSVVFLGDLFDGGREWATSRARPLKASQRMKLLRLGVIKSEKEKEGESGGERKEKRSLESYQKAVMSPHHGVVTKKDHFIAADGRDLKEYVHGEDGRWKRWGQNQWDADLRRFSRIFFDQEQLYPHGERTVFPAFEVNAHDVSVQNGADNASYHEYATVGGKQRRLIAGLPGNHDVGFGRLVQWPVRDRFEMHFGATNQINIIGNHTFVSVDSPSLSAMDQYLPEGAQVTPEQVAELEYIWKPTMDFLEAACNTSAQAVRDSLQETYPELATDAGYHHQVVEASDYPNMDVAPIGPQKDTAQLPVILLTHVPLYRDPDTHCGKLRERGDAIPIRAGYQYQNVITPSISSKIINLVSAAGEIVHIFSGDDHDYCDIVHRYNIAVGSSSPSSDESGKALSLQAEGVKTTLVKAVREITVKSFSWAMGVRKPGFLLVSLWNPINRKGETIGTPLPTVQTHLCLLPDQLGIFLNYAMLFGITIAILLLRAIVLSIRTPRPDPVSTPEDSDPEEENPLAKLLVLPRFKANGSTDGNRRNRNRAASTSTSNNHNSNSHLSVQRSYNARTRSVSPAAAQPGTYTTTGMIGAGSGGLIEKAGLYPQIRWTDPNDPDSDDAGRDSDEESHMGGYLDGMGRQMEWVDGGGEDGQAKWKRRKRMGRGRLGRGGEEFAVSVAVVAVPVGLWYAFLIKNG